MNKLNSFRDSLGDESTVLFAHEYRSQPDLGLEKRHPLISKKNDSMLTVAREDDILLLTDDYDHDYHKWIRSLGYGTDNIYVFEKDGSKTLPELMMSDDNFSTWLNNFSSDLIYVPRYSGPLENAAASHIGAKLLGSDANTTLKFYDKSYFKNFCQNLGLPVVPGEKVSLSDSNSLDMLVEKYLPITGDVIIKDLTAAGGANIFSINQSNLSELDEIKDLGIENVIVESKLNLKNEVNIQYMIDTNGKSHYIVLSDKKVYNFSHAGNSFPTQSRDANYMVECAATISDAMSEEGYIGVFGVEFLESKSGVYVSENNARLNGSTHIVDLLSKLKYKHESIGSYQTKTLILDEPVTFNQLKEKAGDLLYDGSKPYGFIPMNVSMLNHNGKFIAVTFGDSLEQSKSLLDEVKSRLY